MNKKEQYETMLQTINKMQANLDKLFLHLDKHQSNNLKVDVAMVNLNRADSYVESAAIVLDSVVE